MGAGLLEELNQVSGANDTVVSISRFLPFSDSWDAYTGNIPLKDFDLNAGEPYLIQVRRDVTFQPAF